ncbi:MAG TPA: glycosyltransferase, exosortase A system-associated [Sedimenticola sp.]|nr:glycosyltransferase, exosortase A system-associated [Sedimenticola sp.]
MRILHILDHSIPLHSGYTFRTRAILENQRALGWETAHITGIKHIAESPEEEEVDGLHFYRTRSTNGWLSKLPVVNQLKVVSTLERRLDQVIPMVKPDILHAHSPCLNGLAALRAGGKHNLPVVYECRAFWEDAAVDHGTSSEGGLRYRLTRALETKVFRQANAVTTICEGLKSDIVKRGIPESKVTVIPNAVDIKRFSSAHRRDEALAANLGLQGKTVLGFIGSFYAYEGLPLLVQSLPEILSEVPDVRLLLVGGGPQEAEVKASVEQLGLSKVVCFTGRVPHNEVGRYYDLVDIFVYPRQHMRLTDLVTPLKPLEAMAQERLVLASDVGGHRELIRDGENGRLFKAGSSDALAGVALHMLRHKESWAGLKQRGRAFVEQERNWPASVSRYRDVYDSCRD